MEEQVIIFDNLRQACGEIAGQLQPVKAIWAATEHFSQPNAKGELYRPKDLKDVGNRAAQAGACFKNMVNVSLPTE